MTKPCERGRETYAHLPLLASRSTRTLTHVRLTQCCSQERESFSTVSKWCLQGPVRAASSRTDSGQEGCHDNTESFCGNSVAFV